MQQAANTLAEQTGGRFVLGLGVSHAPMVAGLRKLDYSNPLGQMRAYLDGMDASPYTRVPTGRAAAAGARRARPEDARARPRRGRRRAPVLDDARAHRAGPPDPRAGQAAVRRAEGGADDGRRRARGIGRRRPSACTTSCRTTATTGCASASRRSRSSGRHRVRRRGRRVGHADAISRRVQAHYDAGATHVCIQPLPTAGAGAVDWECLEALAPGA